jgi:mRNA interferase MazF
MDKNFSKTTKEFDRWNQEKKQLHNNSHRPAFVSEREIWWCSVGINIGREQDGRADNFERPVLVLKVLSPDTCIALPLSTKKRLERFQSEVTHGIICGFALLDQIRVLDTKRLRRKVGTINQNEFTSIQEKLKKIL